MAGGVTLGTFIPVESLPPGDTTFTFSLADEVSFSFTLPVLGGTDVAIGGTVIASDFAITLEEFRAGRSSLLAYLSLEALQGAPEGEAWAPIGHLEIDGRRINLSAVRDDEDGRLIASAVEGVENADGTWKLVIDELVGHNGQMAGQRADQSQWSMGLRVRGGRQLGGVQLFEAEAEGVTGETVGSNRSIASGVVPRARNGRRSLAGQRHPSRPKAVVHRSHRCTTVCGSSEQ